MNYLKAALAGFGMSFIGTALCGAKMGTYYELRRIKSDIYANDCPIDNNNHWFHFGFSQWNVTAAFLINNAITIPTALLGALFHDKAGRDLTPKINSYFDSEISPYLVTGGVFGILGTAGMAANLLLYNHYVLTDPTQPWIYSLLIIEGFVIGAAAMAGAYFGDEKSLNDKNELESTVELELENFDQQMHIET